MDKSYKRLGVNTLWVFLGNIGPRLVSFLLMPLYTYWLNPADFGIQDIILTYSTLLIPYVSLGLYEAVFVFPKDKQKKEQSAYLSTSVFLFVTFYLLFCLSFFLLEDNLSIVFPDRLFEYRHLLLFLIFTQSCQRIIQFFLRGIDRMKDFSLSGIVYALVIFIGGLILIPIYGLNGYWISLVAADILSIVYISFRIRIHEYLSVYLISIIRIKEMINYSLPLIPNATMWWIVNSINRPIMISSIGLEGVGLYAVAGKFPSVLSVLFVIFFGSFQISALEEYGKDTFNLFYNRIFKLQLFIQILIVIFFELFGDLIFKLCIDQKYAEAVIYLPLFCCGVLLSNLAMYVGVCFLVIKKTKYMLYSAILAAIVAILANYFLIPQFGIFGACFSVMLSQFAMMVYRYIVSSKTSKIIIDSSVVFQVVILVLSLLVYYLIHNAWITDGIIIILLAVSIIVYKDKVHLLFCTIKNKLLK